MKAFGCLFVLAALGFFVLEGWVYYLVASHFEEYLGVAVVIAITSFVGFRLTRYRASQMPAAIMSGRIGQQGVSVCGAILITIPGILSTCIGILLQLAPLQSAFSGIAAKIVAALVKIAYERMGNKMPGGMGGMAGGFPQMGGGNPFAGMQPDDSVGNGKGGSKGNGKKKKKGKIIDMK